MLDFSEYTNLEDVVTDLYSSKFVLLTIEGRKRFPDTRRKVRNPKFDYVTRFKSDILALIANTDGGAVPAYVMTRKLRPDNHPDEFKIAVAQLIEEKAIRKEELWTGKRGRPTVTFRPFEF